ncbi:High mobility group [Coemansia sp. RSA 1200]|nr:High mobility group [Coemansia sp. RSA 1200]
MAPLNNTGIDVTSTTSNSVLPITQIEPIGTASGYQPFSFDASEFGGARVISDFTEATCSSNPATNPGNNAIDNASILSQHNTNGHHTVSNEAVPPLPEFSSTISNGPMGYSNSPLSNSLVTASVPGNGQLQPHPPNQQTPLLNTNTLSMPSQMRPYNMMFGLPGMNCESRSFYDDHLALPPLPHNGGSWLRIRQPIDLVTPLKKPMNSFLLYSAERRVQLRQTHPDLNTTQQSTILAREWASLAEEEKEKYRAEAKQLRDDYNARRAELSLKLQQQLNQQHLGLGLAQPPQPQPPPHDQSVSSALASSITAAGVIDYESHGLSAGNSGGRSSNSVRSGSVTKARARLSSPAKRTRKKGKKDPDAPKHPMSAFLYYLTSERPRLADQLGDMSIGQQTKIIAKQWKTLDENDKAPWERLAKHDKDRYARERREYHGETQQSTTPAAPN